MIKQGRDHMMGGSTPTGRGKSYAYYKTRHSVHGQYHRVLCEVVDSQIPALLDDVAVDPALIPQMRHIFTQHLDQIRGNALRAKIRSLKHNIAQVMEEEASLGRLYATGRLSEETYNQLYKEWQDKLFEAKDNLRQLERTADEYEINLETAVAIMPYLRVGFERLVIPKRKKLLQILFNRIMINSSGNIIEVELNSPFAYLDHLHWRVKRRVSSSKRVDISSDFYRSPLDRNCFELGDEMSEAVLLIQQLNGDTEGFIDEPAVTSALASRLTGYQRQYINRLCLKGELDCYQIAGRIWLIKVSDLQRYIDEAAQSDDARRGPRLSSISSNSDST